MVVGELAVLLGFKVDDSGANSFDKKLKSIRVNLTKLTLAATAAIYAIDRFVESTSRASVALANFSVQTGLSSQKLQQWQFAATMSNTALSADQVTQSIQGLNQALLDIKMGQGNPEAFYWLGVNPMGKDSFEVLKELSSTVKNLDPQFASMQLRNIGLSEEFLNVLKLSNNELEDLFKRAPIRSAAWVKALTQVSKLSKQFRLNMQFFFERVIIRGMPAIEKFYTFLERGIKHLVNVIEMGIRLGDRLLTIWDNLPNTLKIVLGVIALLRAPMLALLLILDDIAVWMSGGDSLFGKLYDKLESLGASILRTFESIAGIVRNDIIAPIDSATSLFRDNDDGQPKKKGFFGRLIDRNNNKSQMQKLEGLIKGSLPNTPLPGEEAYDPITMERIYPEGNTAADIFGSNAVPSGRTLYDYDKYVAPVNTFNNTYNIQGTEPQGTADAVVNTQQRQLNHSYSDNSGGMIR